MKLPRKRLIVDCYVIHKGQRETSFELLMTYRLLDREAEHQTVVSLELEMLFLALLLLLLSQLGDATFEGKRYNLSTNAIEANAELYGLTGSGFDYLLSFGYLDDNSEEVYRYVDRDIVYVSLTHARMHLNSYKNRYKHVEQACFDKMTSHSEYVKCLTQPNIVYIAVKNNPLFFNRNYKAPEYWTLDKIELTVDIEFEWVHTSLPNSKEATGSSVFLSTNTPLEDNHCYNLKASKNGERHPVTLDCTVWKYFWDKTVDQCCPHSSTQA
uniref:Secreted protein n=1 Tax=Steinernema glaseri TaxID=37863 RepID=A0A1I7Y8A2_9BILA